MGDFDSGFLKCPADGASVAAEGGSKLICARAFAIAFYDLRDLAVAKSFLLLLVGIDFYIGIIGLIGNIWVDIRIAIGLAESEVLPAILEYARGRVETRSQKCHHLQAPGRHPPGLLKSRRFCIFQVAAAFPADFFHDSACVLRPRSKPRISAFLSI